MCKTEEWIPVNGYDGYRISNMGRVVSLPRTIACSNGVERRVQGGILSPSVSERGYCRVSIGGKRRLVHRLVMEHFSEENGAGLDVCHFDGNPSNNDVCNLRYDTRKGNMADQKRHGTHAKRRTTHCPRGHELAGFNLRKDASRIGLRKCRSCTHALKALNTGRIQEDEVQSASDFAFSQYRDYGSIVDRREFSRPPRSPRSHCFRGHELIGGNLVDDCRCRGCRWAARAIARGAAVEDIQTVSDWASNQYLSGVDTSRLMVPAHLMLVR